MKKKALDWLRTIGIFCLCTMFLSACGGGGGGGGTSTPTAPPASASVPATSFSVDPPSGTAVAPATVTLTDTSTNNPTGCDTNFGDGTTGTGLISTHIYNVPGTYLIKRKTFNNIGIGNEAHFVFVVTAAPPVVQPSVADFTYVVNGSTVTFTYAGTSDATGWFWNFGDGSTSSNKNPVKTYATTGSFPVTLVATNAGGPSLPKTITVTIVAAPPSARLSFPPLPDSDYIGKVNVLINRAYVDLHPELTNEILVKAMFDDINAIIMKDVGNKKRFILGRLIVYEDADFNHTTDNVTNNPAYYDDNHFVSNPNFGGSNLILWFYTGPGQIPLEVLPKYFCDLDPRGFGRAWAGAVSINGKVYNTAHLAAMGSEDVLLVMRDLPIAYVNGFTAHNAAIRVLAHELGHGAQIGFPEGYSLNFSDSSGTLPNLGAYDHIALSKEDPMVSGDILNYNITQNKFSQLHSFFIEKNATRLYDMFQLSNVIKLMPFRVKVVDAAGNPVAGATVTSFGGVATTGSSWGVARNMVTLLETKPTDAAGLATLTNDFNVNWFAKGIKASSGGQYGGRFVTSIDLHYAYWILLQDEFVLTITILPQE